MLGVKTNVSMIYGCFNVPFFARIGVQCVKILVIEHVTCSH